MSYFSKTTDNSSASATSNIITSASGGTTTMFSSAVAVADGTDSTNLSTGALKISGGASVGGNLIIGANATTTGNLTIGGSGVAGGNISNVRTIAGLQYSIYSGYHNGNVNYVSTSPAALVGVLGASTGYGQDLASLSNGTASNLPDNSIAVPLTVLWTGYFYTGAVGGEWTFSVLSDDIGYLWIGDTATSGYKSTNVVVAGLASNPAQTGTIVLLAGTYYPMRILYGDGGGGRYIQMAFTPPGGVATTNGAGYFFSRDTATITPTVFKYLSTVTSPVQTQLTTLASVVTTNALNSLGLGYQALQSSTGTNNTAIGYQASRLNAGAGNGVSLGVSAAYSNVSGGLCTAVGVNSLFSNLSGASNTAVGANSLFNNATGTNNTGVGSMAGYSTRGSYNSCLGDSAGQGVGDTNAWNYATAIGAGAVITASNQVVLGRAAEFVAVAGNAPCTAVGTGALRVAGGTSVAGNVYITGNFYSNGAQISAVGPTGATGATGASGASILPTANAWTNTNSFNTALPTSTITPTLAPQLTTKAYVDAATIQLKGDGVGNNNNAFGTENCFNTIKTCTGIANLALGNSSLFSITSGGANVAVGQGILSSATAASFNTGVGSDIMTLITTMTAHRNVGMGSSALSALTSGAYNTAIGCTALTALVSGAENAAVGNGAGQYTKGSYNTLLGSGTGQVTGDTNAWNNSTALGYGAVISASNQMVLGRKTETVIIPGVLRAAQEADPVTAITTFSTTPTFDMNANGMVYSMTPTAAMTSTTFSNIPTTPASSYSFTFVLQTGSAYYIKPSTISVGAGGATYTATLVGLSNVVLPTSYTYLVQTINIVATGTVAAPTFIALTSVAGY